MPKISELNPLSSLSYDDLVPVVNDPNGSPSNNKVTFKNFANSVVQFFNNEGIFDYLLSAANTGNVTFTDTTISTRNTSDNLILTTKENSGNVSIETAGNMKFDFIDGVMIISSSEYGGVMGIGQGMGPTIASNGSLYQYSFEVNEETNESWDQGSVSYPGTNQLWTQYGNSESTSARSSYFTLRSDVNNISTKISLANRGSITEKNWEFNSSGALILPNQGSITDNFSILEFKASEAYDVASMSGNTITFDNASSTLLRDVLAELEVGDQIQLDGGVWSVTYPYTGGINGSFAVNGDFSIPDIQFIQLPDKRNLTDGIRLSKDDNIWTFSSNGEFIVPGDIISGRGSNGSQSHFVVDGSNYWTSMKWINFSPQPSNAAPFECQSQLLRVFSDTGEINGHEELVAVSAIQDNDTQNGLMITTSDGKIPDAPYNDGIGKQYNWIFTGDGNIKFPANGNIVDTHNRPILDINPNALNINTDGGTASSIFAAGDEMFTGGGSTTIYGDYEASLDGGFSYNNKFSTNRIDGGGAMTI